MAKITLNGAEIEAPDGTLLSEVVLAHHALEMPCAGRGKCGKCRVKAAGALSPVCAEERAHLTADELRAGVRLACCCRAQGDCRVSFIEDGAGVVRLSGDLTSFEPDPMFSRYGAAVDIGTTTVAAQLYDANGLLAEVGCYNPQRAYGADVISRVGMSLSGKARELAACIRKTVSDLLMEMSEKAGVPADAIDAVVITGNTAMLYLLTQRSPAALSAAPFEADCLFGEFWTGAQLELPAADARVYLPACMSAFVGADIATAVLASGITRKKESALLADIGTNGEIVLWHNGRATCCSTAAGPAFEGAGLTMGMSGKPGAVDHVKVENGEILAHVIGETEPKGICGSGIIDAIACLLKTGAVDETGFLEDETAFIKGSVCVTAEDIRMIQLAKSAVCSGIQTLLHTAQIEDSALPALLIAGGFGSYLDVRSAADIGLIPMALVEQTRAIGNAALAGASMLLRSQKLTKTLEQLAQSAQTLELSTNSFFLEAYVENMMFPE